MSRDDIYPVRMSKVGCHWLLYMFRTLSASIIRSTKTVVAATGASHESGWYISSKDVQVRLPQRQQTLDFLTGYVYHPDPWPVPATTVFSTPDAGRRKRPKHVEWSVATDLGHPYWIYIIPTHDKHQWLLLQYLVLLMMDAKAPETCRVILQWLINNTMA